MTTEMDIQNQIDFAQEKGAKLTAIQVAKAMLADNVALNLIAKYTGLSEAQILDITR